MKKSMTKIMKGAIAIAMSIGMGVGAAVTIEFNKTTPVYATEGDWSWSGTSAPAGFTTGENQSNTINDLAFTTTVTYSAAGWSLSSNNGKTAASFTTSAYSYHVLSIEIDWATNSGKRVNWNAKVGDSDVQTSLVGNTSTTDSGTLTFDNWSDDDGTIQIYSSSPTGGYKITGLRINAKATLCSITYKANGGTGDDYVVSNIVKNSSHSIASFASTGFSAPSGKQFDHWDTQADDLGTDYNSGVSMTVTSNVTLFAQWSDLPDDPYVASDNSSSGYTGQTPAFGFSFGNFVSSLSITSNNTDVVTIGTINSANPESSTVVLNYVGPGSAGVVFKDGASTVKTVTVSVTQTTLTLNKDTTSINHEDSETLIATTNVGGANWTSNNAKVTVNESGVVSVAADAVTGSTATITATSNVDSKVSDTCVVTVTREHGRLENDPLTVAQATSIGTALANNGETTKDYYVVGYISEIVAEYGAVPSKASFWLANGTNDAIGFEAYKVTLADGLNSSDIKVGSEAKIHCNIKKYVKSNNVTIQNGTVGEIVALSYSSRPATSLSLDKNEIGIGVGGEATLKTTILPVYATEAVVWSSSNNDIATVNDSGLIIGVGVGSATITATVDGLTNTCSVNVYDEMINPANSVCNVLKPASVQNAPSQSTFGSYELNLQNAYNRKDEKTTYNYMMFGTKELGTENSLISNKTPVPGAITKIVFRIKSGSAAGASYNAIVSSTEITTPVSDDTNSHSGEGSITINASVSSNLRYFAISCTTSTANGQLEAIEITYETTQETIESYSTRATLSYGYTKLGENSYTFDDVAIRFGGLISVDMWTRLNSESTITGYGVVLSTTAHVTANGGQLKNLSINGSTVVGFEKRVPEDKEHPVLANAAQKGNLVGDYYIWNLYNNVPESFFTTSLTAVTYIKTSSGNVYFQQVTVSVQSLADSMVAGGADTLEGSLNYLANLA